MGTSVLSITISTFNIENYIIECLNCVLNQSLSNIEVIIIDDGSTDNTQQILKEFVLKDSRIKAIFKSQNEGLAVSRNEALKLAKGKYIAFVDGDDLLDVDLFQRAVDLAEKENSDLAMWDYAVFYDETEISKAKQKPSDLKNINPTDKIALLQRPAFAWTKLIRTEKARELGIHFPEGLTRQDIPVHWKLITNIDKISILLERLSYYRQQPEATTHKKDKRLFDLAKVTDIVKSQLIEDNLYENYKDEFLRQQLGLLSGMVDHIKDDLKPKAMQLIQERLGDEQWAYINSKKPLNKHKRDFYLAIQGSVSAKIRQFFWLTARKYYRLVFR